MSHDEEPMEEDELMSEEDEQVRWRRTRKLFSD